MTRKFEGDFDGRGKKFAVVVARFNELITSKLLEGAKDALVRHGTSLEDIHEVWVPGSYELPLVAEVLGEKRQYDAIICLGAVIRGATTHYELVCAEAAKGIAQASLRHKLPVVFGVLTTENIEQALERAGTKAGNKGFEAGLTAIEMTNLLSKIRES